MSVRQLTQLAGGTEVSGRYRLEILRIEQNGQTQLAPVRSESELVRDGEILFTLPDANQVVDRMRRCQAAHLSRAAIRSSPECISPSYSRRQARSELRRIRCSVLFRAKIRVPICAHSLAFRRSRRSAARTIPRYLATTSFAFSRCANSPLFLDAHAIRKGQGIQAELTRNPYAATQSPASAFSRNSICRDQI